MSIALVVLLFFIACGGRVSYDAIVDSSGDAGIVEPDAGLLHNTCVGCLGGSPCQPYYYTCMHP